MEEPKKPEGETPETPVEGETPEVEGEAPAEGAETTAE